MSFEWVLNGYELFMASAILENALLRLDLITSGVVWNWQAIIAYDFFRTSLSIRYRSSSSGSSKDFTYSIALLGAIVERSARIALCCPFKSDHRLLEGRFFGLFGEAGFLGRLALPDTVCLWIATVNHS